VFEAFRAFTVKGVFFWIVMPCIRRQSEERIPSSSVLRNQKNRPQAELGIPWRWRQYFSPKRRTLSKLYGVKTQKTLLLTKDDIKRRADKSLAL
jgi:hypothetical protein